MEKTELWGFWFFVFAIYPWKLVGCTLFKQDVKKFKACFLSHTFNHHTSVTSFHSFCLILLVSTFCLELRLLWKLNSSTETHSHNQWLAERRNMPAVVITGSILSCWDCKLSLYHRLSCTHLGPNSPLHQFYMGIEEWRVRPLLTLPLKSITAEYVFLNFIQDAKYVSSCNGVGCSHLS